MYSKYPIKVFARVGLNEEPIATPSTWLYIISLKLSSTSLVAIRSRLVKFSFLMDGFCKLYNISALILITSSKGTLENRFLTSKEDINVSSALMLQRVILRSELRNIYRGVLKIT